MNSLFKQIINFIGFSGIGWILDFTIYTISAFLLTNLFISNILGAIVGVTFVFIFSTRYVFQNTSKIPLWTKYLIYIAYQIVLVYLISKLLVLINSIIISYLSIQFIIDYSPILSKIIVTPITMLLNFIVLKNMIERI